MSAHVLLNVLKELRKRDKMRGLSQRKRIPKISYEWPIVVFATDRTTVGTQD